MRGEKVIGSISDEISALLGRNNGKGAFFSLLLFCNRLNLCEVELAGPSGGKRALASVDLYIAASDVRLNAELALKNLVEETTRREKPSDEEIATRVDELAEEGQHAIQSNSSQSLQAAIPGIDNFIQFMDNVADVRVSEQGPLLGDFYSRLFRSTHI